MALESQPPISGQFRLLAFARWHAFRNKLRKPQKQAELVFKILFWLSGFSTIVFGGLAFFSYAYFLFPQRPGTLVFIFWIIFGVWQIIPLVLEGQSPALDFREIARYPITFKLFFTLSVAYGLLDPAAVIACCWAASAWLGIVLSSPHFIWRVTLAFALFLPMNLFINRVVFGVVARLTQTRSGRERLMGITLFTLVAVQFVFWMLPAQVESHPWIPTLIRGIARSLPPGWAADIALATGSAQLRGIAATLAATLLFAGLLYRICRRTYMGETPSEGSRRSGAVQLAPGWRLPFLQDALSAAIEKELRYVLKDSRIFTNLFMVWAFCFVTSFSSGFMRDAFNLSLANSSSNLYPAMVGYSLLVINMLAFNIFGNDSPGFQRWLLSPLPMRQVMIAKNVAFAGIVVANLLIITAIYRLRGPIPLALLAKTALGVGYATLAMVAVGNVLSVWFPKKIIPGKLSGKNVSEAAVVASLIAMVALGGSWFAVTAFAKIRNIAWLPYVAFAGFVAIAAALYWVSLRLAPAYIARRLDNMLAELG